MVHHRWTYKQNNKNLGLTRHHRHKIERTWHIVIKCKEMEQEYTGTNNVTSHLNPPHLVSNLEELNILVDSMEKRLGLRYTSQLINCRRYQNGFDEVCKTTFNLAFLILQLNRTTIKKIQQVTNNEGSGKNQDSAKQKNC